MVPHLDVPDSPGDPARVSIFDTTLRDGEQSPGASMTRREKLRLARQLDQLGVDVVEAGFPIASDDDFEAVRSISKEVTRPTIAALARLAEADIDRAASALEPAAHPRLHVFVATSDLHLEHKLRMTRAQCLDAVAAGVQRARRYVDDIEFSAEDATRTDLTFLCRVVQRAVDAGARTINVPDTVGYSYPGELRRIIQTLRDEVTGLEACVISVHCHNDLGLAVANSLAAVESGARQIECTVNGIGERAGNAALEEIVMALYVRRDLLPFTTGIRTQELYPTSRMLTAVTGIRPQPNKAVVGKNAFAHEAGIHQAGMIRHHTTYEIMRPETVGVAGSQLVLGKHSGRAAVMQRCLDLGYRLSDDELDRVYGQIIEVADWKKTILDEDVLAIVQSGGVLEGGGQYELIDLSVTCGGEASTATVTVSDSVYPAQSATATGDGPLAAAFAAMDAVLGVAVTFDELDIRSATPGPDAVGEVLVRTTIEGKTFTGRGAATDIVTAAVQAYLHAVNKAVGLGALTATGFEFNHDFWGV